jgi:hypothetical protein
MRRDFVARCLTGVAAVAMMAIPAGGALSLSQTCGGTPQSFQSSQPAGSATDPAQPFQFTVPATGRITIDAAGAQGGAGGGVLGGNGAEVAVSMAVNAGDVLCIVTGVQGGDTAGEGGGGGGSFVFKGSSPCAFGQASATSLLVAAAGGGSGGNDGVSSSGPGLATGLGTTGSPPFSLAGGNAPDGGGAGGTAGQGGNTSSGASGAGGGGLTTAGADNGTSECGGGAALVNGATGGGGSCAGSAGGPGGFGGGGAAGGGGGYNGGGGTNPDAFGAGGGGSFSAVAPIFAMDGTQTGNGAVSLCTSMGPVPALSAYGQMLMFLGLLFGGLMLLRHRRA